MTVDKNIEPLTVEQIRKTAKTSIRKSDNALMVAVEVVGPTCTSNGKTYGRGEKFEMEISLVPVHVQHKQIEVIEKTKKA